MPGGTPQRRTGGHLRRGTLVSVLLHAHVLVPILVVTWRLAAREEAQRAGEVDVSWQTADETDLPEDLPAIDRSEPAEPTRRREAKKRERRAAAAEAVALAEPEPEVVVPPLPPMPEEPAAPQPRPQPEPHATPVDLDMGKDVPPPDNARYLAQKNNRADVETRAIDTVLDRNQDGDPASSPSKRASDRIGDDVDRERIAETEDQKSQLGRSAPQVTPHAEASPGQNRAETESLLSMRAQELHRHEVTPETADPSLPRDPDGVMAEARDEVRGPRAQAGRLASGKPLKLRLTGQDYEHIFGAAAEAERRFAQTERSKRPGRFQERMGRVRAALENFTPEVRPGNQTALNTRAAPFAAFVARMHRSIHRLWGFGILEDWDEKPAQSPFNDMNLSSTIEIVLDRDGTVDKVTVVRNSGYLPYDAAAVDAVYSAGPYPDPPREIRSKNGKIYLHWLFRRDGHQCHPSGVSMYILDNPPAGGDRGAAEPGMPSPGAAPRVPTRDGGPRRLERPVRADAAHRAKMRELDEAAGTPEGDPAAARRAAEQVADPSDPEANQVARRFFAAYAAGQVAGMVGEAAFPFRSADGGTAAAGAADLGNQLKALVAETPSRTLRGLQLFSAAGLRGAVGKPPAVAREGGLLFAVARAGNQGWILVLDRRYGRWKAVGLVRR